VKCIMKGIVGEPFKTTNHSRTKSVIPLSVIRKTEIMALLAG
jgi:hypothetical protein